MRIFSKSTLKDFYEKHADSKEQLLTWYKITNKAKWKNYNDIKSYFNTVDCIKDNLTVFNLKGNKYRLAVDFNFRNEWAFIIFIGTHAEYDKKKFK